MKTRKIRVSLFDILNATVLLVFALATIYPFLDVLQISLSTPSTVSPAVRFNLIKWIPKANPMIYWYILRTNIVQLGYLNTLIQVSLSTFFALLVNTLAAYPLSKKRLLGRGPIMVYITVTMFFSGGLIPSYLIIQSLGMYNTLWAIILPSAFSVWNMIMMRTFFQNIPIELEEAAQVEGANDLYVLLKIYVPLSKALYATMTLFFVVGFWNNWFNALIYLQNQKMWPIQLLLKQLLSQNNDIASMVALNYLQGQTNIAGETWYGFDTKVQVIFRAALMVVVILPLLVIYPFAQKYFVKGVMIGSIKG
jgi:putative aldouronate transport system permease protein